MAKQLMDRGCRVKCMAMGTGQQYLEEQLQRFLILIEDVSNVEYGPKIEQRNGYFIARHIKFGVANKKEAQQTIKSVENGTSKTEKDNIKKTSASEKKKEDTAVSPKEEFLDKTAQFEEHAPVEQFEEIVDEFPSIDTAEAISNGLCLPTSETKMHSSNTIQQQESVVGDTNCYTETETYLEDLSRNHDSLDQARQALTDIGHSSSNIERQFASDQSLKQCRDPTKVKAPEFLKKGHFSLPLSTNLNVVTEKKDQHGISDGKLSESASSEVIFGRIHSDQGHFKENVGKVSSADSHFNCAKVSIKDNVKDIPDDYHINASTTSEVTQTIAEELQTTPATLNNDGATQEQQPRAQILAGSLRRVLVKHSSGDQHTSKADKQPLPDLLLKQASESRWAVLRQVKPSGFIDNTNITTPSITTNFVEKLQTSHVDLNNDTTTQVQQKITTGTSKFPADDQEECASKARMRPSTNMLSEQADEFQWASFRQVKSSHFIGDNNTGRQDELGISNAKHHANQGHHVSSIGKQIPLSSVSLPTKVLGNGVPYTESGIANAKQPTPSEHEKQGYFDPNKAAQKPLDSTPKQGNNTGDSNTMYRSSLRTLDAKTIPVVDIRKVLSSDSRSGQGNCASSTGKQDPTDSFSKQVSAPVGSRWGIFSQPKSNIVDNQRYPAKATEKQSKDWSGVLQGPNTVASEAQSDAAPRHLHIQNQRKVPTSSMGIGMQDQKQTVKEDVDQPRQKNWGIFSMKVPTKAPDDKEKSEV